MVDLDTASHTACITYSQRQSREGVGGAGADDRSQAAATLSGLEGADQSVWRRRPPVRRPSLTRNPTWEIQSVDRGNRYT